MTQVFGNQIRHVEQCIFAHYVKTTKSTNRTKIETNDIDIFLLPEDVKERIYKLHYNVAHVIGHRLDYLSFDLFGFIPMPLY